MYAELQKKNKKITFVEGLPDSYEDENLIPLITPIKITWLFQITSFFRPLTI